MDKDLYYCKHWLPSCVNPYEILISDIIYSDEKKYFQIHGIVQKNSQVVRITENLINNMEVAIKNYFLSSLKWLDNSLNKNIIKIWYYNEDDSCIEKTKIPLRFAITALDIIDYEDLKDYKNKLVSILLNELEKSK